jgi:hypothetical protein
MYRVRFSIGDEDMLIKDRPERKWRFISPYTRFGEVDGELGMVCNLSMTKLDYPGRGMSETTAYFPSSPETRGLVCSELPFGVPTIDGVPYNNHDPVVDLEG